MARDAYQRPELYEAAFAWRDYSKAVDFVLDAAREAGVDNVGAMVELGCGPGQYCREFAKRGITGYGIDLSPEMVAYTQRYFDKDSLPGGILEDDMRHFDLPRPVDVAICMMSTFCLLTTNQDVVANLRAVAANLNPDGLYLIELPHPRDVFNAGKSCEIKWDMDYEGDKLLIDWGSGAAFDPIAEVSTGTVTIEVQGEGKTKKYAGPEVTRGYTYGLMQALVELSGCFEIATIYGDIDTAVPFDNEKKAWRMVLVLRKL